MINKGQTNTDELRIQGLLDRYLRFRSSATVTEGHLDEDSLSSFVEGRLSKREATPILKHLIDCSFCLNVTVELARLELAFNEEMPMVTAAVSAKEPAKVSDVLKNLLSSIFGTQDGAVFAHHESEEKTEEDAKEDKKES
jgi:hypothetical protein